MKKLISGEKVFEYVIPMAPLVLMIILTMVPIPKNIRGPVMFTTIPLMFVILWFQEVAIRDRINKFPHLMMIVRPKKRMYHLYIESGRSKKIVGNIYSTILDLAFPIEIEEAEGEIRQIKLNHVGRFPDRVNFDPGKRLAKYFGQWVDHPQSEIIEVHRERHQGRLTIVRGNFVPTYILDLGSKDKHGSRGRSITNINSNYPECKSGCQEITQLNRELVEYKSQAALFHEDSASYGEVIDQKEVETRGLLKAKTGGVDYAIELLLALYRACGTIDKTIKELRPKRFKFEMWMLIPISVIVGFIYLQLNPSVRAGFMQYLSVPQNQVFVIVLVVAFAATIYYVKTKVL